MLAIFVRWAILAAVCCGTSSLHEAERLTRKNRDTNEIQLRSVLVENLNVEIYRGGPEHYKPIYFYSRPNISRLGQYTGWLITGF